MRRDHRSEAPGRYTKPAKTQGRIWGALGHFPGLEEPSRCFQGAQNTIEATVSRITCTQAILIPSQIDTVSIVTEDCVLCDRPPWLHQSTSHIQGAKLSFTPTCVDTFNHYPQREQAQADARTFDQMVYFLASLVHTTSQAVAFSYPLRLSRRSFLHK